jgi:hypothetical protein
VLPLAPAEIRSGVLWKEAFTAEIAEKDENKIMWNKIMKCKDRRSVNPDSGLHYFVPHYFVLVFLCGE